MVRVLVVSHSADPRDSVLWEAVLDQNSLVDLVIPVLKGELGSPRFKHPRVIPMAAIEPFGKGHSSMWIKGLGAFATSGKYDLVHAAFEPWSLIPQALCGRVPTVVQGAESVVADAHWAMKARRIGLTRVLNKAAGVLTWGQTSLDAFRCAGLPSTTPQGVIPMGIPNPLLFSPTPVDSSHGPLRLLYVGRLVPEKGILTLIRAVCELGQPAELRVLGEGPLAEELQGGVVGNANVSLILEGKATAEQVSEAMAWSHAVVVPSEPTSSWKEQWGRVAVEAMLSARPTVVSDSGELPHLVTLPELIFPAGDVPSLTVILGRLNADRPSLGALGNSLRTSADRFAPDRLARELNDFWILAAEHAESR
jgi:glycosyltransferase involved in cell wall biosynthesis